MAMWQSFLMGLWVNMVNMDIETGYELAPYTPATPVPGCGLHRFILCLYKQEEYIDTTDPSLYDSNFMQLGFSITGFASNYSLGDPVACNFYVSKYPERED
ncbi:phosphatidylethanolamine-binding protein 1-like [Maniola jurtina]|uniref:phosphatidylethanolamine-binding protein 1-like n=1 Tax=Maniola jurtina TaxID=191418 RepID=UPI001E68D484|nr:phosphatidylethanolamine-binding protein 1-like [Maniola jurtina]